MLETVSLIKIITSKCQLFDEYKNVIDDIYDWY